MKKLSRKQMSDIQDAIITVLFTIQMFLVVIVVLWMLNIMGEPTI